MNDIEDDHHLRLLVSIPMYAVMQGLGTVREVQYNQLSLKLKKWVDKEEENRLVQELRSVIDLTVVSAILQEDIKSSTVDRILSWIFNVIILITMFLCFFSLSSSMSANIYD